MKKILDLPLGKNVANHPKNALFTSILVSISRTNRLSSTLGHPFRQWCNPPHSRPIKRRLTPHHQQYFVDGLMVNKAVSVYSVAIQCPFPVRLTHPGSCAGFHFTWPPNIQAYRIAFALSLGERKDFLLFFDLIPDPSRRSFWNDIFFCKTKAYSCTSSRNKRK